MLPSPLKSQKGVRGAKKRRIYGETPTNRAFARIFQNFRKLKCQNRNKTVINRLNRKK